MRAHLELRADERNRVIYSSLTQLLSLNQYFKLLRADMKISNPELVVASRTDYRR